MLTKKIKKEIQEVIHSYLDASINLEEIKLEIPNDKNNGDLATNIAFVIAKRIGRNPIELAEEVADKLKNNKFSIEAKSGFLNFTFSDQTLAELTKETIRFEKEEKKKTMVLDYSAPNIAKPFGIGHLRSTIVGQAIYNIYDFCGWQCVGINHLGDWGTQYGKLIRQIKKTNKKPEDLSIKDLEKLYVQFHKEVEENPEVEKEGRKWFKKLEEGNKEAREIWKICVEKSMKEFEKTYSLLGIEIDHNIGESFYQDKIEEVIEEAKEKEVAQKSEGALIVDFDQEMPPAMLLKSNGGTTYFSRDLATVKYRIKRWNPDLFVYEIGADQKLHMRQLFKTVEMLGWAKEDDFMHVAHGMYRLKSGAMSTRKGQTIHLEDVLDKAIKKATRIIEIRIE
jgi:arginyl-tRNA synthetase